MTWRIYYRTSTHDILILQEVRKVHNTEWIIKESKVSRVGVWFKNLYELKMDQQDSPGPVPMWIDDRHWKLDMYQEDNHPWKQFVKPGGDGS